MDNVKVITLLKTFSRIKKISYESELLRLLILAGLAICLYYPFISARNMGSNDAHWYQYILHDALLQLNHGLFPTYVGQSIFSFFGGPIIRAPYYILLGQFLHVISFGQFSALTIQHLTVLFSASLAAFMCYFLLVQCVPKLRWWALLFSFFYISCPGVIGLIYDCDAYNAFMTIPFIPLAIYGLIRTHQKEDNLAYLLTAAALALIWMGHPPIACWATAICILFYLLRYIFFRKGILAIPLVLFLITLFCFWEFVSVASLKLGTEYAGTMQDYAYYVIASIKADIPDVFLPLRQGKSSCFFLQLGYSLWFVFLIGIIASLKFKSNRFTLYSLIACIVVLLLFLYPLPLLGQFLWSIVPQIVANMTNTIPQQRFYVILAGLTCFIGILAFKNIAELSKPRLNRVLTCLFILLSIWNSYEAYFFITMGQTRKSETTVNAWDIPENIYFYGNHLLPIHGYFFSGAYDPQLKNKLLDKQLQPIPGYDNEMLVIQKCFQDKKSLASKMNLVDPKTQLPLPILSQDYTNMKPFLTLKGLSDKWQLLCLKTKLDPAATLTLEVIGSRYVSDYTAGAGENMITLPLYREDSENKTQTLYLRKNGPGEKMVIEAYSLTNYQPDELPIHMVAFTPYIATVETKTDNTYLQIFKEFLPGYIAFVNGEKVDVLSTKDVLVLIPLKHKGFNRIELVYVGTPLMRFAFYFSSLVWAIFMTYLLILGYRRYKLHQSVLQDSCTLDDIYIS